MDIQSIISLARKNDQLAFQKLFDMYSRPLFTTSYRITNNREESKDILQECFLDSFRKLDQLSTAEKYPHWLRRMVINKSLKYLKSRRMHFDVLENDHEEINHDEWYKSISWETLKTEIQALSDGCRTVFTLYALEDYKHSEISEILNIHVSTSKSQYRYACKILKSKLKKYIDHEI